MLLLMFFDRLVIAMLLSRVVMVLHTCEVSSILIKFSSIDYSCTREVL